MQLLLISYYFPPAQNPRAFRWGALADHWARQGHRVEVVTASPPVERAAAPDAPRMHHVPEMGWGRWRKHVSTSGPNELPRGKGRAAAMFRRGLRKLHDATWRQMYWPDAACLWLRPAWKTARRLAATRNFDACITVSHPFTAHLVGLRLQREFPGLRWLTDIGDPFSFLTETPPNNFRLHAARNHAAEEHVLRHCAAVAVTCQGAADVYAERFAGCKNKLHVIPPLLPAQSSLPTVPLLPTTSAKRLVYCGSLYRDLRNPERFLRLFAKLRQGGGEKAYELHFFGDTRDCRDIVRAAARQSGGSVVPWGVVSRESASAAVHEADVLVNFGNTTPFQVPSKLVEYMATGKPIVHVSQTENDASWDLLAGYLRALRITADLSDDRAVPLLREFLATARKLDERETLQYIEPYRLERIAEDYLDLCRSAYQESVAVMQESEGNWRFPRQTPTSHATTTLMTKDCVAP